MYRIALAVLALALVTSAAQAEEVVVAQKGKVFSIDTATIKPGDTVKFVNDDTVTHNVYITGAGGEQHNNGTQEPGQTTVVTFDKPGNFTVECLVHPKMHMSIVVK
jgi:plastocyanin